MNLCIGGPGVVVEIDESVITKAKITRNRSARPVPEKWVIGMFDRNKKIGIVRLIDNRTEITIISLIRKHCFPGTRIITDGWAGYNNLHLFGYIHDVVIHKDEFVVNGTNIHTNNIENYWKRCKAKFKRMNGTTTEMILSYIDEFMWNERFGTNCIERYNNTLNLYVK
jgi:transposase-like protein